MSSVRAVRLGYYYYYYFKNHIKYLHEFGGLDQWRFPKCTSCPTGQNANKPCSNCGKNNYVYSSIILIFHERSYLKDVTSHPPVCQVLPLRSTHLFRIRISAHTWYTYKCKSVNLKLLQIISVTTPHERSSWLLNVLSYPAISSPSASENFIFLSSSGFLLLDTSTAQVFKGEPLCHCRTTVTSRAEKNAAEAI
jgi:hypothetical protein